MRYLAAILLAMATGFLGGCDFGMGAMGLNQEPEYTIHLKTFNGPTHMAEGQRWLQQTQQQSGWKDLFVVVGENQTDLYRGKYVKMEDTRADMRAVKSWQTTAGYVPYGDARMCALPGDDVGPAEYNLRKTNAVYTVVVATYTDEPDSGYYGRRNSAVELCKTMRRQGEQAYFCHGPTTSIVTVGLFGLDAYKSIAVPITGYSTGDPNLHLSEMIAGAQEERVPVDPRINQIVERHPELLENGNRVKITVQDAVTKAIKTIYKPSLPIIVPGKEDLVKSQKPQALGAPALRVPDAP